MDELAVWIDGIRVAVIRREKGRIHLAYTEDALDRFDLGTPLVSLSLPLIPERYPQGVVTAFLDNLLPEGEPRRAIARELGTSDRDVFGLIRELGRDCAGALVIQPNDEAPPVTDSTLAAEPIEREDLAHMVENLRFAPLGTGGRVRVSLAGVQEKLALTRLGDGQWGRPVDGTPSTHILKPEIAAYPFTVENEAFCMRLAKRLGLDVATVETTTIAERKLIIVERFDRLVASGGQTRRLHQEDFCQAFGLRPDRKYEDEGGPSLCRIAQLLMTVAERGSADNLLKAVVLNVVLGNGDAHAKNYSILRDTSGALRLAPLYDLMSTLHYGDGRLAMSIGGVTRIERISADRILNEATGWGMNRGRASELLDDLIQRIPEAVMAAADETPGLPMEIPAIARSQLELLKSRS
ncbi:MAG: kinase [Acidobacteria bacterium]|nr:MAG: kinase [Acidobacteriota bacterium]